jgi:hypothetical protein
MRTLSLFVGGSAMVLCVAAAALAEEPANQKAISERIAIQESRLPQIEDVAAREREQTERWYERRRAEITHEIARRGAAKLSLAQRSLWTEFAKMESGRPYPAGYFDASYFGFPFNYKTALLRQSLIEEYFTDEMGSLLLSDAFRQKLTQIVDERLAVPLTPRLRREARDLLALVLRLRAELTMELTPLENARTARREAAMKWERDLKEQVRGILEHLRQREAREPDFGVVQSIGYFPRTGYFCMVEGVDRVLGIGDRIGRVRVLRIDREKVEFAGDGARWAQQLGAPAQPYWRGVGLSGQSESRAGRVEAMD